MGFKEIASSPLLYGLVIVGILMVAAYAAVFLKKAYGRCLELGFDKKTVNGVIKSSLTFSVVPSISIVIGFLTLSAALGVPWPWWRLSVLGAVGYELMAADMATKGMGYESLAAMAQANDPKVFGAVMFVMTIGIIGGLIFVLVPFGKKLTTGMMKARKSTSTWGVVFSSCFMLTMVAVFLPLMVTGDPVQVAVLVTSAVVAVLLGLLIKVTKWGWLNDFVLAITLIVSMVSAVGWNALLH